MSMHRQQQFHAATASISHAAEGAHAARILTEFDWDERRIVASDASGEEAPESGDADAGLEDAARSEHEYLRQRLRDELKREPTEEELNEWLRQHTEGH